VSTNVEESKAMLLASLQNNRGGAARDIVALNAGASIYVSGLAARRWPTASSSAFESHRRGRRPRQARRIRRLHARLLGLISDLAKETGMAIPQTEKHFDAAAYLAWEDAQIERHEYVAGEVFAMVGVRQSHNVATLNLASALRQALKATPCRVFVEAVKARVEAADCFFLSRRTGHLRPARPLDA
jgi:hypothetical protein